MRSKKDLIYQIIAIVIAALIIVFGLWFAVTPVEAASLLSYMEGGI